MRYYWDRLQHFFVSNSRHGTHSPFVYDLAVHAIYSTSHIGTDAVRTPVDFKPVYKQLLLRILARMQKKELAYFEEGKDVDVLWTDLLTTESAELIEAVRSGKLLVIHEPLRTIRSKRIWEQLMQSQEVIVSINLFHFGLLLHKAGQRKENFCLRYPFWLFKKLH